RDSDTSTPSATGSSERRFGTTCTPTPHIPSSSHELSVVVIPHIFYPRADRTLLGALAPSPPLSAPGGEPLVLCFVEVRLFARAGCTDPHFLLLRISHRKQHRGHRSQALARSRHRFQPSAAHVLQVCRLLSRERQADNSRR